MCGGIVLLFSASAEYLNSHSGFVIKKRKRQRDIVCLNEKKKKKKRKRGERAERRLCRYATPSRLEVPTCVQNETIVDSIISRKICP